MDKFARVSAEEIERKKTPAGGWAKETLAAWGVSWPPQRGWKKKLEKFGKGQTAK